MRQDPYLPPGVTSKMIDDFFGDDGVSKCCGAEVEYHKELEGDEIVLCCECRNECEVISQSERDADEYDSHCDYLNDCDRDERD